MSKQMRKDKKHPSKLDYKPLGACLLSAGFFLVSNILSPVSANTAKEALEQGGVYSTLSPVSSLSDSQELSLEVSPITSEFSEGVGLSSEEKAPTSSVDVSFSQGNLVLDTNNSVSDATLEETLPEIEVIESEIVEEQGVTSRVEIMEERLGKEITTDRADDNDQLMTDGVSQDMAETDIQPNGSTNQASLSSLELLQSLIALDLMPEPIETSAGLMALTIKDLGLNENLYLPNAPETLYAQLANGILLYLQNPAGDFVPEQLRPVFDKDLVYSFDSETLQPLSIYRILFQVVEEEDTEQPLEPTVSEDETDKESTNESSSEKATIDSDVLDESSETEVIYPVDSDEERVGSPSPVVDSADSTVGSDEKTVDTPSPEMESLVIENSGLEGEQGASSAEMEQGFADSDKSVPIIEDVVFEVTTQLEPQDNDLASGEGSETVESVPNRSSQSSPVLSDSRQNANSLASTSNTLAQPSETSDESSEVETTGDVNSSPQITASLPPVTPLIVIPTLTSSLAKENESVVRFSPTGDLMITPPLKAQEINLFFKVSDGDDQEMSAVKTDDGDWNTEGTPLTYDPEEGALVLSASAITSEMTLTIGAKDEEGENLNQQDYEIVEAPHPPQFNLWGDSLFIQPEVNAELYIVDYIDSHNNRQQVKVEHLKDSSWTTDSPNFVAKNDGTLIISLNHLKSDSSLTVSTMRADYNWRQFTIHLQGEAANRLLEGIEAINASSPVYRLYLKNE